MKLFPRHLAYRPVIPGGLAAHVIPFIPCFNPSSPRSLSSTPIGERGSMGFYVAHWIPARAGMTRAATFHRLRVTRSAMDN